MQTQLNLLTVLKPQPVAAGQIVRLDAKIAPVPNGPIIWLRAIKNAQKKHVTPPVAPATVQLNIDAPLVITKAQLSHAP